MKVAYLNGQYGFPAGFDHIAGPRGAARTIDEMGARLVASGELVGIYIPESAEGIVATPMQRGRIVGLVRLAPMPSGQTPRDYCYALGDPKPHWPVGWPCEVVHAPPAPQCPFLRDLVLRAKISGMDFQTVVGILHRGPFRVPVKFGDIIAKAFGA